ncbi:MAG TPA: di-heme oxidoredictase family protein [Polyangiaceae bacterium]
MTISGTVADNRDRALAGVTVEVVGAPGIATVTDMLGNYELKLKARLDDRGFWAVQPSRQGCRFTPSVDELNTLAQKTVADFTGSGRNCVGDTPVTATAMDPGCRPGPPSAGGPRFEHPLAVEPREAAAACLPDLAPRMLALCEQAFLRFQVVHSVSGTVSGEEGVGLGPTFNGNGCAMCHAQPAILGSSPGLLSRQHSVQNPQIALATKDGALNSIPPFITPDGPIRIVRYKSDFDVHDVFTIAGRVDARDCRQAQPDFAANLAKGNAIFRIPLQLFGLGLIEVVSEAALEANLAANSSASLGIAGMFNTGNDGTITRFGRKAQDKSLLAFAAEAYNVEVGVTNELFPEERHAGPGCILNGIPEDTTDPSRAGSVSDTNSDIQNFAIAIRLSAPPAPALPPGVTQASADRGRASFVGIGCANCHTPELTTSTSNLDAALSRVKIRPFSDFALHHMGVGLADGIVQGMAGPDQFRTTPLWGVGQRLFFLHDGRTTNIVEAIEEHSSSGSEANTVITNFNSIPLADEQDIVDFLRSL